MLYLFVSQTKDIFIIYSPKTPISHFNDLEKNNNLVNPSGFFLLLLVVLNKGEIKTLLLSNFALFVYQKSRDKSKNKITF